VGASHGRRDPDPGHPARPDRHASGTTTADATSFELVARRDSTAYGICSNPFLEHAFTTVEYRIKVDIHADGTWGYDEDTVMLIRGKDEPFHHTDRNLLTKIAEPTPNPMGAAGAGSSLRFALRDGLDGALFAHGGGDLPALHGAGAVRAFQARAFPIHQPRL